MSVKRSVVCEHTKAFIRAVIVREMNWPLMLAKSRQSERKRDGAANSLFHSLSATSVLNQDSTIASVHFYKCIRSQLHGR